MTVNMTVTVAENSKLERIQADASTAVAEHNIGAEVKIIFGS